MEITKAVTELNLLATPEGLEGAGSVTLKVLKQGISADEPVDILITLGNAETETAVDYLQADTSYKRQFMIYGEGCSDKTVYYLDKGIIKSLVVPNEFNMGYQSVHTIAEQIKYKFSSAESTTVDSLVINRQNLYDEENQKTLFPIVQ